MLRKFIKVIGGDPDQRELERLSEAVQQINDLEPAYEALSDAELAAKTVEFRQRLLDKTQDIEDPKINSLAVKEALDELVPEAFAAVREASKRTIGLRHYDVQMIGGMVLHSGKIAEMRTGEGKTLVATLPLYLNGLAGRGAHLITVNDYLARRDARWMAPIYNLLGMSVGVLQMAARTENGKKAFLIDLQQRSPHEDQDQLQMVWRSEAYSADITYGTNSEFGFDYLRDNMTMRMDERVQRGHYYAIVDEVDNVLIDEARTPLIISGPAQDEAEHYIRTSQVVRQLRPEDYEVSEKDRSVSLTEVGESHVEEILGVPLRDPDRPEDITNDQARMLGYLEQALRAQYLYKRNKDYLVQARKVVIIDEFTGRMMPGRRWSDGLHQAVEAKEGVPVQNESVTYATITIQNYFRMYGKLAGMTGTAMTESEEFYKIYKLNVLAIPTNLEFEASLGGSELVIVDGRDQDGYKVTYYSKKDDPLKAPVFWKRKDFPDMVYRTEEMKLRTIAQEILTDHSLGRPVLVGTTSVELSERLSDRLKAEPLRRLALATILRNAYLQKHNLMDEMRIVPELAFLNQPVNDLDIVAMRKLARELEIAFNPDDRENLLQLAGLLLLPQEKIVRLEASLRGGIPHEVLNARKHSEESKIIAKAGGFGSVTIATNMAGRGVDIKLGGELPEEINSVVNRILERNGFEQAFSMTMEEKRAAIESLEAEAFGIYGEQVESFQVYLHEMEQVKALGGLHVIGSERHEARRIDNQLRGRSARQGDPGSSRFYLSMEDQLMRLFGGQQADALMQRMKIDDSLPIESGLVGRLVEQAQTSVEGANFDVRKHLLEYDDVLNAQRLSIYSQRDRIFTKPDITEDVLELLRVEVLRRVPEALSDQGGAWKLLAWLDQVQPPLVTSGKIFPSYALKLILEQAINLPPSAGANEIKSALLEIARNSIEAEKEHLLTSVQNLFSQAYDRMRDQIGERQEIIDNFFEGLEEEGEEASQRPVEILKSLSETVGMNLRLSTEALREFHEQPEIAQDELHQQVEGSIIEGARLRLVGSVERRMNEELSLSSSQLQGASWETMEDAVLQAVSNSFDRRIERFLQAGGQIERELDNALSRYSPPISEQALLNLLLRMPQGAQAVFDKKTHKRVLLQTTRLNFTYYAADFLENEDSKKVADSVLAHLEIAQDEISHSWGAVEFKRLGSATISSLDEFLRNTILEKINYPQNGLLVTPLSELPVEIHQPISEELGKNALGGVYRQLLLNIIGQLWVEYLTQMESLRISIGLEAYAQRDPLVQYKSRASGLFQDLLNSMRLEMVNRMFTYRPRDLSSFQAGVESQDEKSSALPAGTEQVPEEEVEILLPESVQETQAEEGEARGKGKRKRHRRK